MNKYEVVVNREVITVIEAHNVEADGAVVIFTAYDVGVVSIYHLAPGSEVRLINASQH